MDKETINQKLSVIISNETMSANEKHKQITDLFEKAHMENVAIRVHGEKGDENAFKEAALPMIKYLCENYHPHVSVIITPNTAELLEGLKAFKTDEYIRD